MSEETIYRRDEQHRDRWSMYGAESGIEQLSQRLSASDLRRYEVFEGFKDQVLETISPDVSIALWREGAVLFEEGSYVDVAFFLVKGAAAAYLSKHVEPPPAGDSDPAASASGESSPPLGLPGETVYFRQSQRGGGAGGATTFLSSMDFDLAGADDVVTLGPGQFFGEIGALNGWPQSVTVKALTPCVVVQIRVPALRLLKRQSSTFRKKIDAVYRERALLPQLRASPVFKACPDALLAGLAERVDLVSCKPGETVIEEGEAVGTLHIVRSGFLRLSRRIGNGEATVTYLSKGMSVGEIELLVDGLDSARFTVSSVGYGELVRIARSDLFEVLRAAPAGEQELWHQAIARIKETGSRIGDPRSSEFIEFALDKGLVEGNSILVMNLDVCTRCDDCVRACADTHGGRPRFVREGRPLREPVDRQILLSLPGSGVSGRLPDRCHSARQRRGGRGDQGADLHRMRDLPGQLPVRRHRDARQRHDVGGRRVAEGATGHAARHRQQVRPLLHLVRRPGLRAQLSPSLRLPRRLDR